jgi:hypothetical protein
MRIGAGLILIAVGAILRFGISTVSTHGFNVHTVGDILMIVGAIGVLLWLVVWAPWGVRSRRSAAYPADVPPEDVPPARRYPAGRYPADRYPAERYPADDYEREYPR